MPFSFWAVLYVVDKQVEPLLSGPAAEALGIITLNTGTDIQIENTESNIRRVASSPEVKELIQKHPKCFKGIGKLKDHQVRIHVDEEVPPVACPPRPVPVPFTGTFKGRVGQDGERGNHRGP